MVINDFSKKCTTLNLLGETRKLGAKPIDTPQHQLDNGDFLRDPSSHQRLVAKLIYLTIDISYVVNIVNQFMHSQTSM